MKLSGLQLRSSRYKYPILEVRQASQCGTSIGDTELFSVNCGVDIEGYDFSSSSVHADSLLECVNICASYHPFCAAVAFEASELHGSNNCYPKSVLGPFVTQTYSMDAAVPIAPTPAPSSDCIAGGSFVTSGNVHFDFHCGFDIFQDDFQGSHESSFENCMSTCATTDGCAGVAYEASMIHGFQNCYMKNTAGGSLTFTPQSFAIDSAVINSSPVVSASSTTIFTSAATSSTSGSSVPTTVPAQVLSASTNPTPSSNVSGGEIAGIVVGTVAALLVIAALALFVVRRRRRSRLDAPREGVEVNPTSSYHYHTKDAGVNYAN